jgi:hypothetical protein
MNLNTISLPRMKHYFIMKVGSFFSRLYSLDVQVLENEKIQTSFEHVEEPYIKSNTHHFACKLHLCKNEFLEGLHSGPNHSLWSFESRCWELGELLSSPYLLLRFGIQ